MPGRAVPGSHPFPGHQCEQAAAAGGEHQALQLACRAARRPVPQRAAAARWRRSQRRRRQRPGRSRPFRSLKKRQWGLLSAKYPWPPWNCNAVCNCPAAHLGPGAIAPEASERGANRSPWLKRVSGSYPGCLLWPLGEALEYPCEGTLSSQGDQQRENPICQIPCLAVKDT